MGFPLEGGGYHGCAGIPPIVDLCPDCRVTLISWWREKKPRTLT
jgi:hypothetical protein